MCSSWWAEGEQGPSRMISTSACVFLEGCLLTIINCIVFSQVHDQESTREKPLWHEEFQEAMVSPDQPWVYLPQNQRWGKPHSPQQWKYNFMLLFLKSSFSLYYQERALCAASPLKTFWLWRGWRKSHSGWKMWASASSRPLTFCLQSAFTPARAETAPSHLFSLLHQMFQVIQPERALYIQANNCVEARDWIDILTKVSQCNRKRLSTYHPSAYLNGHWLCCKMSADTEPGCTPCTG